MSASAPRGLVLPDNVPAAWEGWFNRHSRATGAEPAAATRRPRGSPSFRRLAASRWPVARHSSSTASPIGLQDDLDYFTTARADIPALHSALQVGVRVRNGAPTDKYGHERRAGTAGWQDNRVPCDREWPIPCHMDLSRPGPVQVSGRRHGSWRHRRRHIPCRMVAFHHAAPNYLSVGASFLNTTPIFLRGSHPPEAAVGIPTPGGIGREGVMADRQWPVATLLRTGRQPLFVISPQRRFATSGRPPG